MPISYNWYNLYLLPNDLQQFLNNKSYNYQLDNKVIVKGLVSIEQRDSAHPHQCDGVWDARHWGA